MDRKPQMDRKPPYSITFFGSFEPYSAIVLQKLIDSKFLDVIKVITTPPIITKKGEEIRNAIQTLSQKENIVTELNLPEKIESDFIITAGYGKLLPGELLNQPKIGALNLHFSLLPKYRGANPGEWAILMGENETGVTVIEMNEQFDEGGILSQKSIGIDETETRESLYQKLYEIGGELLPTTIVDFAKGKIKPKSQPQTDLPYASRFKKPDSFIYWVNIKSAMHGRNFSSNLLSSKLAKVARLQGKEQVDPGFIARAVRAFHGFPSVWTEIPTKNGLKRMKILSAHVEVKEAVLVLDQVQIEGQQPALWNQVKNQVETF